MFSLQTRTDKLLSVNYLFDYTSSCNIRYPVTFNVSYPFCFFWRKTQEGSQQQPLFCSLLKLPCVFGIFDAAKCTLDLTTAKLRVCQ